MKFLPKLTLALSAIAISSVALAGSHGGDLPPGVKARQAHMSLYGHNIGILAQMARGNAEYNADAAMAAAGNLAALSRLNQMSYWAPGTDSESIEGTRALPKLWDNIPDAIAKGQELATAAAALAETAGDGLEAVQAGLGPVGGACGACHKAYRVPDDN